MEIQEEPQAPRHNGIVYMLTTEAPEGEEPMTYVGSTILSLDERYQLHLSACRTRKLLLYTMTNNSKTLFREAYRMVTLETLHCTIPELRAAEQRQINIMHPILNQRAAHRSEEEKVAQKRRLNVAAHQLHGGTRTPCERCGAMTTRSSRWAHLKTRKCRLEGVREEVEEEGAGEGGADEDRDEEE